MSVVAVNNQNNNNCVFSKILPDNHYDLIDLVRYSLEWSKYFFSSINKSTPVLRTLEVLQTWSDTFCLNFIISDFNAIFSIKKIDKKIIDILSDAITDICDTIEWLSSSNIAFVGIRLMRFQVASSIGMIVGYGKRTISTIAMIIEKNENHLWLTLIKNISYLSLGILGIISSAWQINFIISVLFCNTSYLLASISLKYQKNLKIKNQI
jgi:hypothetical protein